MRFSQKCIETCVLRADFVNNKNVIAKIITFIPLRSAALVVSAVLQQRNTVRDKNVQFGE